LFAKDQTLKKQAKLSKPEDDQRAGITGRATSNVTGRKEPDAWRVPVDTIVNCPLPMGKSKGQFKAFLS